MLGRNLTKYFTSSAQTLRYFSEAAKKAPKTPKTVVLLPGDGIGPEITESVIQIFDH
jgi:isocitrate dehydrogenase (NAD+)